MASRWMQPKLDKLKRDNMRAPHDVTRTRAGHTVDVANRIARETGELVKRFTGVATVGQAGKPMRAIGKRRREFDGRTFGNGRRIVGVASDYYSLWATDDLLIKRV